MKNLTKLALAILGVLIGCTTTNAQTINIGPNEYAFQFTGNPNFGLFFNQTDGRYEFLDGTADPVIGFNANTGNFTTDLGFEVGSDLVIGNNRYAFRSATNPNFGLFFSAGPAEYQLLDGAASPVFSVNANTGNSVLTGGLRLGNSVLAQPGNIRWTGSDFQGYTGSNWTTLTGGSVGPQGPEGPQGPQGPPGAAGESGILPDGGTNSVPFYNGSEWIVNEDGLQANDEAVGIGAQPLAPFARLNINGFNDNTLLPARSTIKVFKNGATGGAGSLTGWQPTQCDVGIKSELNIGNSFTAAVYGSSFLDWGNSAAVLGTNATGTIFGALGYNRNTGILFDDGPLAGYFKGRVWVEWVEPSSNVSEPFGFTSRMTTPLGVTPSISGAAILGTRFSNEPPPSFGWPGPSGIRGYNFRAQGYTSAVIGINEVTPAADPSNSAAVLGYTNTGDQGPTYWAGLGYVLEAGVGRAGYFEGPVDINGRLTLSPDNSIPSFNPDFIRIDMGDPGNFLKTGIWAIGSSGGDFETLPGDLILGRDFSTPRFAFWVNYFKPLQDATVELGQLDGRWLAVSALNGTISTSDAREKKNIEEIEYGLETLMKMKPVSYEWIEDKGNFGTKLGFVAQDLLEVVPEVVVTQRRVENRESGEVSFVEADRMGVFYDDLIPVLTKAIQEQQGSIEVMDTEKDEMLEDIEALKSENNDLKQVNDQLLTDMQSLKEEMEQFRDDLQSCCFEWEKNGGTGSVTEDSDTPELGQNIPNPFSESTIIRYYLPDGAANAIIRITDMEGSPVEDIQLGIQRGANQVDFLTQGLASGTYLYSLFVDGKFIDTKKMVVAR